MVITNKDIFFNLYFLLNDIISCLEITYFNIGAYIFKNINICYILFRDLTIFSEFKTNLGLFFLHESLNLQIFCTGCDLLSSRILLRNLKLYLF